MQTKRIKVTADRLRTKGGTFYKNDVRSLPIKEADYYIGQGMAECIGVKIPPVTVVPNKVISRMT